MKGIRSKFLILLVAMGMALPVSAAEIDTRVLQQLNDIGMAYQIDGDNDFAIVIEFDDGRSQMLFVRSKVYSSRGMGMRDVWSHAFVPGEGGVIPAALQTRLLEENFNAVMGGWVRSEDRIAYMAKIPEDAPAEVLRAAILEVAELADELEKELHGSDEL
ncbi:MAG: hypothetical protein R3270_00790 [Gammaproteobacteria bacterium]|nr:hypothetical protein [Gammaproteobacteria bacterium]